MCLVNTGDPILLYGVVRQLPYFLHRFAAWVVQASLGSKKEHQTWLGAGDGEWSREVLIPKLVIVKKQIILKLW